MLDLRTACRDWYKPYDLISFNVATDDYGELMSYIYTLLIQDSSNKMWGPDNTVVWVLHQQAVNRKPFKWFILELVGAGDNKIMLAIRRDNLYITGFTDGSGLWYIFSNRPRELIPVATVFRLADDYPGLVGGSRNLAGVRVSKQTILEAVELVASFVPRDSADVGYVGRALAIARSMTSSWKVGSPAPTSASSTSWSSSGGSCPVPS